MHGKLIVVRNVLFEKLIINRIVLV